MIGLMQGLFDNISVGFGGAGAEFFEIAIWYGLGRLGFGQRLLGGGGAGYGARTRAGGVARGDATDLS